MPPPLDRRYLRGTKVHKLTLIDIDIHSKSINVKDLRWLCECECGNKKSIAHLDLFRKDSAKAIKSCGCLLLGRPWTIEDEQEILRLYGIKQDSTWVATTVHRTQPLVRDILRQHGLLKECAVKKQYNTNHDFFKLPANEKSAYWAGFIAADGNIMKDKVRIALQVGDKPHLEKFAKDINYDGPIKEYISKPSQFKCRDLKVGERPMALIELWSNLMPLDLYQYNITPNKTHTLKPWDDGPEELQHHYIRGLIDGDGSIGINSQGYPFMNLVGTKEIVEYWRSFVKKHTNHDFKIWPNGKIWIGAVQSSYILKQVIPILYNDATVWLDRKKLIADKILATRLWGRHIATKPK